MKIIWLENTSIHNWVENTLYCSQREKTIVTDIGFYF